MTSGGTQSTNRVVVGSISVAGGSSLQCPLHELGSFTDGRGLPPETTPSWFGYSVGKWEGDVFVAETLGFNDKSWLDDPGRPHSEALRVTERFRRVNFGRMEMQITFDDPKAYTKPWSATIPFTLLPDTELIESICENERDHAHIIGK